MNQKTLHVKPATHKRLMAYKYKNDLSSIDEVVKELLDNKK